MSTSLRYLIGIIIGIISSLLIGDNPTGLAILSKLVDLTIRIGQYLLFPMIFFSLPVAVLKLRRSGKFKSLILQSTVLSALSVAILSTLGILLAWFIKIDRIPVVLGTSELSLPELSSIFLDILKTNWFQILTGKASFVLPIILPAFLIGWHMLFDQEVAQPTLNLFDSIFRLIYRANQHLLKIMPILLTVLSTHIATNIRSIIDIQIFLPMIIILATFSAILIWLIYPTILWILWKEKSCWRKMHRIQGVLIVAFISGSPLFNYGNLTLNLKNTLKIPRKNAALIAPLHLALSRAGTAMISAFCMLTIIRSYSSLELTFFQISWTVLFSFITSFLVVFSPARGLAFSLIILGSFYNRGLENGWLILIPALPILTMISSLLDTATNAFLIIIVNRNSESDRDRGLDRGAPER